MRHEGGGRGGFRSYGGRDDERENRNVRADNFGTRGFRPFSTDRGGSRNYNSYYRGGGRGGGGFRSDDDRGYSSYTNPTPRYRDNVKPAVNNGGNNAVNTERSNLNNNAGRNAKNPFRRPPRNTYKRSVRYDSPCDGKALKKSDSENDAGEDLFNANEDSYTVLPPEKLPKNLHTVKISGLPRKLSEKRLYNFAKCFGVVVNIYEIPDALIKTSETASQNPEEQQNESVATNNEVLKQKDSEVSKPEVDVVPNVEENGSVKLSENQVPEAEEKEVSKSEEKKAEEQNVPLKKSDDVVNDAENVPKGEENLNEKPAVSESGYYSALISFARSGSAYSMKRLNGTIAFGSHITVEYDKDRRGSSGKSSASKNSSSSGKIVRRKEIGIFRLPNDVMIKVFGFLDFVSRGVAELVCQRWESILCKVRDSLPPAEDKPKSVAVYVAFGPPEMKIPHSIIINVLGGTMTVTINEKRRRADYLHKVLAKGLSYVSGVVMEINISGEMNIDKPIFELFGKYCNKNCTYTFEKVIWRNISLAYINGFIRQCDSRLKIVPNSSCRDNFSFSE